MPHKDPEARAEYQRQYRRRTHAKRAARRPNDDRARNANRRARQYGVPGRLTFRDIDAVLRPGAVCIYCGGTTLLGIDHRVSLSEGGANERSNLDPCCRSCNASKFRSDRPRRWSRTRDDCEACGTTTIRHGGKGLCTLCYARLIGNPKKSLRQRDGEGVATTGP